MYLPSFQYIYDSGTIVALEKELALGYRSVTIFSECNDFLVKERRVHQQHLVY